jgi:hypothetical protein
VHADRITAGRRARPAAAEPGAATIPRLGTLRLDVGALAQLDPV